MPDVCGVWARWLRRLQRVAAVLGPRLHATVSHVQREWCNGLLRLPGNGAVLGLPGYGTEEERPR